VISTRLHCFSPHQSRHLEALGSRDFSTLQEFHSSKKRNLEAMTEGEIPTRLQLAEAILLARTSRIVLVMDKCYDMHNIAAVLRTAECFGVQNVYMVLPVELRNTSLSSKDAITRGNERFLTLRKFRTSVECIEVLRAEGREIWATDLSQVAVSLDQPGLNVPNKLAIVMGREAEGVTREFLEAADRRVFLPLFGFTESLNLSVATALVLQKLLMMCPEARGDMSDVERRNVRRVWYEELASSEEQLGQWQKFLLQPPPPLASSRKPDEHRHAFVPGKLKARIVSLEEELVSDIEAMRLAKRPRLAQAGHDDGYADETEEKGEGR